MLLYCSMGALGHGDLGAGHGPGVARAAGERARKGPHSTAQAHRREQRVKAAWFTVAFTLFIVLAAAALLAGGGFVFGPALQWAGVGGGTERPGDVLLSMPDGTFCRRLSFDNATAELGGGNVERCPDNRGLGRHGPTGFAWGGH